MMLLRLLRPFCSRKEIKKSNSFFERGEMKRHLVLAVSSLCLAVAKGNLAVASTLENATERLQNSADILEQIATLPIRAYRKKL